MSGTSSSSSETPTDGSSSTGASSVALNGVQPSSTTTPKPRKHVTTACVRCRQAKARCDGNQPCARCAARNDACNFRHHEDERTRTTAKRRLAELQGDSELLHDLLRHIRHDKDAGAAQIVSLIRSDASLHEIHQRLIQFTNEARSQQRQVSPQIDEMRTRVGAAILQNMSRTEVPRPSQVRKLSSSSRNLLSIQRLCDTPRYQVRAAPWTQVTSDDHLVSHLVSLWATWDNCFPTGVVFEFFLRDMRSQNLESTFCSPFLVNCILAAACPYSDYDEVRAHQGKTSELIDRFVKEAEKHLEEDNFQTSITNVQGLSILFLLLAKMNQDRKGFGYATQTTTLCSELIRARDKLVGMAGTVEKKKEVSYVIDYACWGAFGSTTGSIMWWQRPQTLSEPSHPYPDATQVREALFEHKWTPYPREGDEQEMFLDEVQHQHATLAMLEREITLVLYTQHESLESKRNSVKQEALLRLDARLAQWLDNLPAHFKHLNSWTPPAIFVLRLWAQDAVMVTLMARMQYCSRGDHCQGGVSKETRSPISIDADCASIRQRLLKVSLEVAELIEIYRSAFPLEIDKINSVVYRPLHQALSIFLDARNRSTDNQQQYDSQITDICITLRAMARRVPFIVSVLRAIQLDLRRRGLALPRAAEEVLEDFEQCGIGLWKEDASYTRAMYSYSNIAPHVGQQDHKEDSRTIGEFLQEFEKLNLQPHKEQPSN